MDWKRTPAAKSCVWCHRQRRCAGEELAFLPLTRDREGEAISGMSGSTALRRAAAPGRCTSASASSITAARIREAIQHPHLDQVADRGLYGAPRPGYLYRLLRCPRAGALLQAGSAGRVQSVASRPIGEREAEIDLPANTAYPSRWVDVRRRRPFARPADLISAWQAARTVRSERSGPGRGGEGVVGVFAWSSASGSGAIRHHRSRRPPCSRRLLETGVWCAANHALQFVCEGMDMGGETTGLITCVTDGRWRVRLSVCIRHRRPPRVCASISAGTALLLTAAPRTPRRRMSIRPTDIDAGEDTGMVSAATSACWLN